ncbi:MAG: STAS domain-containing protein [Bernardetiaceae bacterium]|nr:STAS domain-containing protein [Bernardetiaceae bacterium]
MKYSIEKKEKYTHFLLKEEKLDSAIAPDLKAEFFTIYQAGTVNLILDLSEVRYVDSSGLRSILIAKGLADKSGGTFVLCNTSEHVLKLLQISKLDSVLNLLPTLEESVDAVFMADLEREIKGEK